MRDPDAPVLTFLPAAMGRRMPWKNGGGETVEIAVHPAIGGLDALAWRVSLARVAADGPFSLFPGLDRTLTVVEGEGLELGIAGRTAPVRLTPASAPFRFPADAPCAARLLCGPVTNLNVMTRRSAVAHTVRRLPVDAPMAVAAEATTLLVCCAGRVAVGSHRLDRHDAVLSHGSATLALGPADGAAAAVLITLRPL